MQQHRTDTDTRVRKNRAVVVRKNDSDEPHESHVSCNNTGP